MNTTAEDPQQDKDGKPEKKRERMIGALLKRRASTRGARLNWSLPAPSQKSDPTREE